jgi:hypothetical protein
MIKFPASRDRSRVVDARRPTQRSQRASLLVALVLAVSSVGCGDDGASPVDAGVADDAAVGGVTARLELEDRGSASLTVTSIMAIKGTYGATCLERSGAWTIALNGYVLVAGETALSVEGEDTGCTLSVTEVKAGSLASPLSYRAATALPLGTAYAEHGVAFTLNGTGPTVFYANFRAEPDLAFSANFVVRMLYSDDVSQTDLTYVTRYEVSVGTATVGLSLAPNATLSLAALDVRVTSGNVVRRADGSATLMQGLVVGGSYFIDADTLGTSPSYAVVDAAYLAAAATVVPLVGDTQLIPAAAFGLVGLDLATPKRRNVVVVRVESGVPSYQLFQITFTRPTTGPDTTPPTVLSMTPTASATGVALDVHVSATFSEAMRPFTSAMFTLKRGSATIPGSLISAGTTVTFSPTVALMTGTVYTATITVGAADLAGNPLAAPRSWSFTTGSTAIGAGPAAINLYTAANFAIVATSSVTAGAAAAVTGDIAVSPGLAAASTGFAFVVDAGGQYATSTLLTGRFYAADYAAPTPALVGRAVADMQSGFADGTGRLTPDGLNLGAGELGGLTLIPGLYRWSAAATITTDVELHGGANDVWILQVGAALSMPAGISVRLTGGARAKNVYWVTVGAVSLGAAAHLDGNVLSATTVALGAGASVNGRLLAGTSVALGAGATVTAPAP